MLAAGMPAIVLNRLHVPIFTFLFVKIITQRQLCQQLVKPVACICFCFFAHKNYNVGVAMPGVGRPATILDRLYILVFAFPLVKIIIWGQLC